MSVGVELVNRTGWTTEESELIAEWGRRATAAQHAHYLLATRLRRRTLVLGLPVTIFSAVVGTSLFATLADQKATVPTPLRVIIGSISLLAAVLSAIQTFLRFAERSAQHAQAADWYSAIRREAEELLALPPDKRGDPRKALDALRKELNKAGQTYPEIGDKLWHRVSATYGVKEPGFANEIGAS